MVSLKEGLTDYGRLEMTEKKRFKLGYVCGDSGLIDNDEWIDLRSMSENSEKNVRICINKMNELAEENEQLKQQKPFLKIHNDYFIKYGDDKELFNLHKPSDIRSLCYLINRENGYDELECEYNEEGYGND